MQEFLRAVHSFTFGGDWAMLFPTPLALAALVLFLWSFAPAYRGRVDAGFRFWLRLTWVLTLLPAVTGLILAVGGCKVASAVAVPPASLGAECLNYAAAQGWAAEHLSRYCLPVQPSRDAEHWMYAAFAVLSLLAVEALLSRRWNGQWLGLNLGYKLLPVITLFLYGCVYMVGRVAVLPGNGVLGG